MYVNIHACIISLHMDTNQVYNINQLTISHSSEVPQTKKPTPLHFNRFAPEKWWLEDDPFLLGPGNFSGAFAVKLLKGKPSNFSFPYLLIPNHLTWFCLPVKKQDFNYQPVTSTGEPRRISGTHQSSISWGVDMVDYLYGITAATTDSEGRRGGFQGAKGGIFVTFPWRVKNHIMNGTGGMGG